MISRIMISSVRPLYAGNALQVSLAPPAGVLLWRLLRKGNDTFAGEADPQALVAYEGTELTITDAAAGLVNEAPAFYKVYYWNGDAWTASATVSGTPRATYADASTDALSLVRDRLEAGLKVEVARGTFRPAAGYIQVLTAPPVAEEVELPIVTVHLENERPAERGLGEMIAPDELDGLSGKWIEHEGWLADVRIEVTAWSLNPDERIALRKAVRRILVANLAIFDAAGLVEVAFEQSDRDLINGEFAAPVYQAMTNFSCQAPVIVTSESDPVADVVLTASGEVEPVIN